MKGQIIVAFFLILLQANLFMDNPSQVNGFPRPLEEVPEVKWVHVDHGNWTSFVNKSSDFILEQDQDSGVLELKSNRFHPYFTHNATIRAAIDASPQWLNDSLSWKFLDISDGVTWRYTSLLTDPSLDSRFLDEIAYFIAYSSPDDLNSHFTLPDLILENVEMMYDVESEVDYAAITDTIASDGRHSTVVYSTPAGNITLPEEIYYRYLMMPVNEMEQAAYINLTTFRKVNSSSDGVFWRSFLYTANDTGYPVLRDLLLNETTLWNGTRNQVTNNGAVGAVTSWQTRVMEFRYEDGMRRDHQPVSLYKQHFGLCGENAELLAAAAKTALIPTVVTTNFDMMHAWNEFFERGWHQWEGYSGRIDDPSAEGSPGSVTVATNMDPDRSFFTNTDLYTTTTNLSVNVRDRNGFPVEGAMVKIVSRPTTNHYGIIPLLGNATDINGEAGFLVGSNFPYYVQILSPIGGWLNETSYLPLAFPNTIPGSTHYFNVTLDASMPLKANLTRLEKDTEYGFNFTVIASEVVQRVSFHRDPWGYFTSIEKSYPDRNRLEVYFLDNDNLGKYSTGKEFFPAAVMNLSKGATEGVILPDDRVWNILISGMSHPLARSFFNINIIVNRSVVTPEVVIMEPSEGTYLVDEIIDFKGALVPALPSYGELYYVWRFKDGNGYLSTETEFSTSIPFGNHTIEFTVFNGSGLIGIDTVEIRIEYPNRPPVASIEGLEEGVVLKFGTRVVLTGNGSRDPDNDTLDFLWRDEVKRTILSESIILDRNFQAGKHHISLTVTDPEDLKDISHINFTIEDPNISPVPFISSPENRQVFQEGEYVEISAEGSYDLDGDEISFRWLDSQDGNVSKRKVDSIKFSTGDHVLTLFVSDGRETGSLSVNFRIMASKPVEDLEPIANIRSPYSGQRFNATENILLSSEGSIDPEGNPLTFRWVIDGSFVSSQANHTLALQGGIYEIILYVGDGNNTASMRTTIIVIDRHPRLSIRINGTEMNDSNEAVFLEGENITFDATGSYDPEGFELDYQWKLDEIIIYEGGSFARSFDAGIYHLRLELADINNGTASKSILLRVLTTGSKDPGSGNGTSDGGSKGVSIIFYIIPFFIILISIAVIVYVAVRSRQLGKEEPEEWD